MDVPQRPPVTPAEPPTAGNPAAPTTPPPSRLFIHEPGWQVALKIGSERVFCYQMAPGQDYYHRLLDGEIYVFHGDERLCLACAERRGLLTFEPRRLGIPLVALDQATDPESSIEAAAALEFILDLLPAEEPEPEPESKLSPDPFDEIDFT